MFLGELQCQRCKFLQLTGSLARFESKIKIIILRKPLYPTTTLALL
jgi:hypothetical protein